MKTVALVVLALLLLSAALSAEETTPTNLGKTAYLIAHSIGGFESFAPPESPTFSDVPTGAAYYAEIEYLTHLGIVTGHGDGLFHPELSVTRDMAAVFVARTIDLTDHDLWVFPPPEAPAFSDVPQIYWAFQFIEYINDKGVLADNVGMSSYFEPTLVMDIYLLAHWLELATGVYVDPDAIGSVTGTIAALLVDKAADAPISTAELILLEVSGAETAAVTTDAMGECSVIVPVGIYNITASPSGYYPGAELGVEISEGVTTPVVLLLVHKFPDAGEDFWAFSEIGACVAADIVAGHEDGTYQPQLSVTRDQMAVYISRALAGGDEAVPEFTGTPTFSDVTEESWALDYVEYAVSQDVVGGYEDGTYRPEDEVSRDQMAVYVARSKGWVSIGDNMAIMSAMFLDVPAGHWAGTAIAVCLQNEVVQGYEDGTYRPEDVVTRDQMAVYVARAFDLL